MEIHSTDSRSAYAIYPSALRTGKLNENHGKNPPPDDLAPHKDSDRDSSEDRKKGSVKSSSIQALQLSPAEKKQVQELKSRDREVRAHEAAHLAAAGPYATGGASFSYQKGPDGRQYAVGAEVGIDTSEVPNDPQATARKAQTIRRAANAPAFPSPQDRAVAARLPLRKRKRVRKSLRHVWKKEAMKPGPISQALPNLQV